MENGNNGMYTDRSAIQIDVLYFNLLYIHCPACSLSEVLCERYGLTSASRLLHLFILRNRLSARSIALRLSPQQSNNNKDTQSWLTVWPLTSHLADNLRRPPLVIAEKARFQFEYFRLRVRHRKDRRVSRDFSRRVTRHHLSTSGSHVARKLHAVSRSGGRRSALLWALLQTTEW